MLLDKRQNIFISPAAFKDCISARGLTEFIKSYLWNRGFKNLTSFIGSDGGNGFLDAMTEIHDGSYIQVQVPNLLGSGTRKENVLVTGNSAAIETASVIGIEQIAEHQRNVFSYTSYPLGVLIRNLKRLHPTLTTFHIGIGGTATMDFGIGMLHGLGFQFFDENDNLIIPALNNLSDIMKIRPIENFDITVTFYEDVHVDIFSESQSFVDIFGPQKGLKPDQVTELKSLLGLLTKRFELDSTISGCGGALGLFPSKFMNVKFISGTKYFSESKVFIDRLNQSDIVITGEGRLDDSTFRGKWCSAFLKTDKPILCISGSKSTDLTFSEKWKFESLQNIEPDRRKSIKLAKPLIRGILDKYISD